MADDKILKPKSFRIDDQIADRIKEISNHIGGNQQETFSKLVEAWEFQNGKAILTEKKADIEQFEKYATALTRMYMGSLEDNQNITETVRTEFEAMLHSKDTTIQDLQSQLTTAKQLKEEATVQSKTYADENSRLNELIESLQKDYDSKIDNLQSSLTDKESLNRALTDSCNDLKAKVDAMAADREEVTKLRKLLKDTSLERDLLKQSISEAEKAADRATTEHEKDLERVKAEMQILQEKAILEVERKYQEQIQSIKEDRQAEIDKYQKKYFDLLEQLRGQETAE